MKPGAAIFGAIALLWLWDLGGHGLASLSEVPLVQRALSWLANPSPSGPLPPLPDLLGAQLAQWCSPQLPMSDWGHAALRFPQYLSALGLLALAYAWGVRRGLSGAAVGLVAASLPVLGSAARHLRPELWAELGLGLWMYARRDFPGSLPLKRLCQLGALLLLGIGIWASPASFEPPLSPEALGRHLMTWVSDFGVWTPLILWAFCQGSPRLQQERRWLALVLCSQLLFPRFPIIGILPVASLLVGASQEPGNRRVLLITLLLASTLLLRTLGQYPAQLVWPHQRAPEFLAPSPIDLGAIQWIWRIESILACLLILSLVRKGVGWTRVRAAILLSMIGLRAQWGSDAMAQQSSVRAVARVADRLWDEGAAAVASHGVEDPGWAFYAPKAWPRLASTQEALQFLQGQKAAALVLGQASGQRISGELARLDLPLWVQPTQHLGLQVLGPSEGSGLPYAPAQALQETAPPMQHGCRVRFGQALELVGWSICDAPTRGQRCRFETLFRVLKPLRGPRSIFAQAHQTPLSPWPSFDPDSLDGSFPMARWRAGDLILVRQEWEVPWLLGLLGEHELSIAVARSRYRLMPITFPTQDPPEQAGMRWRGASRKRIVLGKIRVQ